MRVGRTCRLPAATSAVPAPQNLPCGDSCITALSPSSDLYVSFLFLSSSIFGYFDKRRTGCYLVYLDQRFLKFWTRSLYGVLGALHGEVVLALIARTLSDSSGSDLDRYLVVDAELKEQIAIIHMLRMAANIDLRLASPGLCPIIAARPEPIITAVRLSHSSLSSNSVEPTLHVRDL